MTVLWDTKLKEIKGTLGTWRLSVRPLVNGVTPWAWEVWHSEGHVAHGEGFSKTHEMAKHAAAEVASKLAKAFGDAEPNARATWVEVPEVKTGRLGNWKLEMVDGKGWNVTKEGCPARATGSIGVDIEGAIREAEAAARALASVFGD
jgi:hypothetical protein